MICLYFHFNDFFIHCFFLIGLRGTTADVVIMEEAAYINPQVFYQVIVPLMGVGGTAILGISTPDNEFNYYSNLVDLKDNYGENIFLCIRVRFIFITTLKLITVTSLYLL